MDLGVEEEVEDGGRRRAEDVLMEKRSFTVCLSRHGEQPRRRLVVAIAGRTWAERLGVGSSCPGAGRASSCTSGCEEPPLPARPRGSRPDSLRSRFFTPCSTLERDGG